MSRRRRTVVPPRPSSNARCPGVPAAAARRGLDPDRARDGGRLVVRRPEPRLCCRSGSPGRTARRRPAYLAVAALEAAGCGRDHRHGRRCGSAGGRGPTPTTRPRPSARSSSGPCGRCGTPAMSRPSIETTSHGLALERVGSVAYDAAILTNVTHEHLEFHGTWEAYRDAKLSLFERLAVTPANPRSAGPSSAIVNADDRSAGRFIGAAQEAGARILTYGTDPSADIRATRVEEDAGPPAYRATRPRAAPRDSSWRWPAGLTSTTPSRSSRSARVSAWIRPRCATVSRRCRPSPGGWSAWTSASHSRSSSTTPTARPRSQTVLDLLAPVAAARGGGVIAVFGRPASGTSPSVR